MAEKDLPPVPPHPDSHNYAWTKMEERAIRSYAQAAVAQWRDAVDAELMQIESTVDSFASPTAAIRALIDFYVMADRQALQQENERLRAENVRLIEDRARFPDRPDDIGRMIGSRFRNLEAAAKDNEEAWRRAQSIADAHAADTARMNWVIAHLTGKAWRSAGITYGDSSEIRGHIDAALAAEQDKGQET